jgi:hypothetical protein
MLSNSKIKGQENKNFMEEGFPPDVKKRDE